MFKKSIYFDNAATSNFKPRKVKKELLKSLKYSANPGRSGHSKSLKIAFKIFETRELISTYFNCDNVIFTKNCTEALNQVILGLNYTKKEVLCSCFEHNSILRPLKKLNDEKIIKLKIIYPSNNHHITKFDIENKITKDTFLVCLTAISNVTGNKNDFEEVANLCHKNKILFLLDFAQGVGHLKTDMKKTHIDFLAFSGHKGFLSAPGVGALCINSKRELTPIIYGGTGTNSKSLCQPKNYPDGFESGTTNFSSIISLRYGIEYTIKNFEKNNNKTKILSQYLISNLQKIKGITLYSNSYYGVISFNYKDYDSQEICDYLNSKYNIATRGGLHCAPLCHKFLETEKNGCVRVSLSFKNTIKEMKTLLKAIKNYKK